MNRMIAPDPSVTARERAGPPRGGRGDRRRPRARAAGRRAGACCTTCSRCGCTCGRPRWWPASRPGWPGWARTPAAWPASSTSPTTWSATGPRWCRRARSCRRARTTGTASRSATGPTARPTRTGPPPPPRTARRCCPTCTRAACAATPASCRRWAPRRWTCPAGSPGSTPAHGRSARPTGNGCTPPCTGWARCSTGRRTDRPLHGDVHAGNLIATRGGLLWNDFEEVCRGPARVGPGHRRRRAGRARVPHDPARLAACRQLRSAQVALRAAPAAAGLRRPSPAGTTASAGRSTAWRLTDVLRGRRAELGLPPAVIEMLARYRRMRDEQGYGWGEDGAAGLLPVGPVQPARAGVRRVRGVRGLVGGGAGGGRRRGARGAAAGVGRLPAAQLSARGGPPRPVIAGSAVPVDVVLDSAADTDLVVTRRRRAGAGARRAAPGCTPSTWTPTPRPSSLACGDSRLVVPGRGGRHPGRDAAADLPARRPLVGHRRHRRGLVRRRRAAQVGCAPPALLPRAPAPSTSRCRPGRCTSSPPAGCEFERLELDVDPAPGAVVEIEYRPRRRFDPAADGWYGGDLHVHLNYSGDHVLDPGRRRPDAARRGAAT